LQAQVTSDALALAASLFFAIKGNATFSQRRDG
jgi:hypothetical protein